MTSAVIGRQAPSARARLGNEQFLDMIPRFVVTIGIAMCAALVVLPYGPLSSCFQDSNANQGENVFKSVPDRLRGDLTSRLDILIGYERNEDWVGMAELIAFAEMVETTKSNWIENRRTHGSFFGKRLVQYRIQSARVSSEIDDRHGHVLIYGCARLRGDRRGYQALIEAVREHGEWRFVGPHTISGIDAPPARCAL